MAYAHVQSTNSLPGTSGTSIVKAYAGAVTAGNFLAAFGTWGSGAGAGTFTDSVNGAWSGSVKTTNDGTNSQSMSNCFHPNTGAGTPSVTFGQPSSSHRGVVITEYSGIATSTPEDGTASGAVQGNGTSHTTGTLTVSAASDLVLGYIVEDTVGASPPVISSADVTIRANQAPGIVDNVHMAMGDKTGPASGTVTVNFAFSTSQGCIIQHRAFKLPAAGGSSGGPLINGGELTNGALIRGGRLAA